MGGSGSESTLAGMAGRLRSAVQLVAGTAAGVGLDRLALPARSVSGCWRFADGMTRDQGRGIAVALVRPEVVRIGLPVSVSGCRKIHFSGVSGYHFQAVNVLKGL